MISLGELADDFALPLLWEPPASLHFAAPLAVLLADKGRDAQHRALLQVRH